MVEETKFKTEGKFKIDDYIIFELTRENKDGGGLALGCVKELKPVLVNKGNQEVEALSVDIFVQSMKIRCCVAYGCQENSLLDKKNAFWNHLDAEVATAWNGGSGFILHFDGNLWAGPKIIPGDPRQQNKNGKMFEEFLSRNSHLTVVNSLPLCDGLITRSRKKGEIEERSILDFFVVCSRVLPFITKMVIDEKKEHILTNYKEAKRGGKATDSDHFTQIMDVNLQIIPLKPKRKEIFNFKNKESQEMFKEITTNTQQFSECFNNDLPILKQVENWRNVLKSHCQIAFKKIRIDKKKPIKINPKIVNLVDQRNKLRKKYKNVEESKEIQKIEKEISCLEADENSELIMKNFKRFSENPENVNLQEVWKVLKTIGPKYTSPIPIAKRNFKGKLESNPAEIKKLLAQEYKQRLRSRPIRPDLGDLKERRKEIFEMHLKLAEGIKSTPWKMSDLDKALSDLKNNKARDPAGYINEIFKEGIIGLDLKKSLLDMFNLLKVKRIIPEFMRHPNITTVPKRGSLTELVNERGIFRVDIIRYILMRIIYNEKYPEIDMNMSDSQMGGRKGKGCRNNLFIINGIIHDVLSSKKNKPVVLQIYDYAQMFDSINLQQAISDVYETGLQDENLSLIYKANKEIFMAVNTPDGLSERQVLNNIVLQGDTFGSILASVQVDTIGQECLQSGYGYNYKDILPVGMLGLVDDIIGITEVGYKAQMMNVFMNIKTAEKGLQFGEKKCKSMLVGKDLKNVLNSKLSVDKWTVEHETLATGETKLVETYSGLTEIEKCEQQKYLGFILSNKGDNMTNIQAIKNKSIGVTKKIFNKLNSLKLQNYYFECSLIFLNVMLRSSILYASETYYNLKEQELRQLERIEESFMRQVLKTKRGCPIKQMYLELGQAPARFDIFKLRGFFLKYILDQDEQSSVRRVFELQLQYPTKNDWASDCLTNLKAMDIDMTLEEITLMPENTFKNIVRQKSKESALRYLMKGRGRKGKEIEYTKIEMAEYLQPMNKELTIENRRKIFEIRNMMVDIPSNFSSSEENVKKCACKEIENMEHIFYCKMLNQNNPEETYEQIFHGKLDQQIAVFQRFEENFENRKKIHEK